MIATMKNSRSHFSTNSKLLTGVCESVRTAGRLECLHNPGQVFKKGHFNEELKTTVHTENQRRQGG